MDIRCRSLHKVRLCNDFKLIFTIRHFSLNNTELPSKPKKYCIFIACSEYIKHNFFDIKLNIDANFDISSDSRYANPITIGIKPIEEELYSDNDLYTMMYKKPHLRNLAYIDCTAILSYNVTHSNKCMYAYVSNVLSSSTIYRTCIFRVVFQYYKSSEIYFKTFENVSEVINLLYEMYTVIVFYKTNMLRTLAYCMVINCNLHDTIVKNTIKTCKLNKRLVIEECNSYLRQIRENHR